MGCFQALRKREAMLKDKEQELLVLREKLESKESVSILSSCCNVIKHIFTDIMCVNVFFDPSTRMSYFIQI